MSFHAKDFAGSHCGCRYQQDYRPTLGRDGKKESGTLEVIKFYYDGAIRMEQHCYGEAATFVFGVWASGMDPDGTLHWNLPDRRKSYYDEDYLPQKLDRVDEAGNLYFDGSPFPWKLADDFAEDPRWGYPRWKVVLDRARLEAGAHRLRRGPQGHHRLVRRQRGLVAPGQGGHRGPLPRAGAVRRAETWQTSHSRRTSPSPRPASGA